MQERPVTGDAEKHKPTWYLARGDKRYGPLADRELLLLAERGGLRTDDLLWKPGFDSWKSIHAFCDVGNLSESAFPLPASTPSDEFADAEVDASEIGEPAQQKKSLRARAYEELRKFLIIFSYLWLVFFLFFLPESGRV